MNHTPIAASESALAETEFAVWMTVNGQKIEKPEHYEVRPCKSVRGFMLRLPGIGWKLWFPTVADAVSFARRVASIYAADCCIYDSTGQRQDWARCKHMEERVLRPIEESRSFPFDEHSTGRR